MFLQGFVFALGFAAGTVLLSFTLAVAIVLTDRLVPYLRNQKEMDGTIDIRRWKDRTLTRKRVYENPRSAG
jgi:hypothetical protein